MKAQSLIYSIVGQGGTSRLSSLRFAPAASPAASVRGFAPIEKRMFLQKFFVDFFSKKSFPETCSPFFSWCGSFLCVTTKKRSYSLRNYLLYLLSYYFPYCLYTPLPARGATAAKLAVARHLCRHSASVLCPVCVRSASCLRPFVRQPCGWIRSPRRPRWPKLPRALARRAARNCDRILGCKIYKILRSPAAKSLTKI